MAAQPRTAQVAVPPPYRRTAIVGSQFLRPARVIVDLPYLGQPQMVISEEEVRDVGGVVTATPTRTFGYAIDPADVIKKVSLVTGEKTAANIDLNDFLAELFSIYRAQAERADGV